MQVSGRERRSIAARGTADEEMRAEPKQNQQEFDLHKKPSLEL